ncbi:Predicted N-acyltransferase, GNAT family [Evansella caseinilytica]|uniref:Predicted N-acyltransferase, GNAT family n=1 Tax=Evansella caseinilytica TaxID=1503961 RepID=A0A1H3MSS4_9BACI|nr:GNAT family N-acetyltransferase [Evansella caseinilytica]SDY79583.1 Predicted N-acyltransferase, GNAT family [Evansella caseinilytica]
MIDIRVAQSPQEMEDVYHVRRTVFIKEQQVPEEIEIDEHEFDAMHFVAYDGPAPVGAGRLRLYKEFGKAERICVIGSHRKQGVGEGLMLKMEEMAFTFGIKEIKLNAQTQAEGFYKRIGYETCSDIFYEAGISHIAMKKALSAPRAER